MRIIRFIRRLKAFIYIIVLSGSICSIPRVYITSLNLSTAYAHAYGIIWVEQYISFIQWIVVCQ